MKPLALLVLLVLGGVGLAAPSLSLQLDAVTVVTRDGKSTEVMTPAKAVRPGDVLLQTAKPTTDKPVRNAHITVPVPKNTSYVAGSALVADGLIVTFSADGKAFSAAPTKTVTVAENGKTVTKVVPVPQNEYVAVRWTIASLTPAQKLSLTYRVRVN